MILPDTIAKVRKPVRIQYGVMRLCYARINDETESRRSDETQ